MRRNDHFGTRELRQRLKSYYRERLQAMTRGQPPVPRFPKECIGMLCGALTRRGGRCRNDGTQFANGRCKFHGGLSTGPKTTEGKANSARNGMRPKRSP